MQEFKGYRIGVVSELLGISVQAIRHYQRLGLVEPAFIDDSGYRYFNNGGLHKLFRINVLKSAGFSLDKIKRMEQLNMPDIKESFIVQKHKLMESINRQQVALNYINRRIDAIKVFEEFSDIKGLYRYYPNRAGFGVDAAENRDLTEHLKTLLMIQGHYGLHQEVVHQPSRYMLVNKSNNVELHKFVALYQDDSIKTDYDFSIQGGLFYCCMVKGMASNEERYYNFITTIVNDGYKIRGDAIELILVDGSLTQNPAEYLKEIQIAVIDH